MAKQINLAKLFARYYRTVSQKLCYWWWSLLRCLSVEFDQLQVRLYNLLGRYQSLLVVQFMLRFTKFYCTRVDVSYLNSYCISLRLISLYGFLPISPSNLSFSSWQANHTHTTFAISDVGHPKKWEPRYLKAGCSGTVKTCTIVPLYLYWSNFSNFPQ